MGASVASERIINERYRVIASLGQGGMGVVHLVEDLLQGNRRIALKCLLATNLKPAFLQNFRQEFRTLANLRHPNLAEVFEFSRDMESGEYFYTCEYVEGDNFFKATRKTSLEEVAKLVAMLCLPLDYIHRRHFVHNDIKPGNVMLLKTAGEVKLLDFGLASLISENKGNQLVAGTPVYMAPEIILGEPPTPASDLYAMGMLLYRLTVRTPSFFDETSSQILRRHLEHRIPSPRQIDPALPKKLEALILRCLNPEPLKRFASALELRQALCEFAGIQSDLPQQQTTLIGRAGLIGRQETLQQTLDFFSNQNLPDLHPRLTDSPLLLITGEEGSGKSRLLREIQVHLQTSEVRVYRLSGGEHEGGFSLWQRLAALMSGEVSDAGNLKAVFQSAKEKTGEDEAGLEIRLADQITRALLEVAKSEPIAILIDDLHLADRPSMHVLHYLMRYCHQQEKNSSLRIAASWSEAATKQFDLREVWANFHAGRQTPHLILAPFNPEESREFVLKNLGVNDLPKALSSRIHEMTSGNPFYLEEVLYTIIHQQHFQLQDLQTLSPERISLPKTFREILHSRIASLEQNEKNVLSVAALLATTFNTEFISKIIKKNLQSIKSSLFLLQEMGFLLPEEGGYWRLKSPALAESLKKDIQDEERCALHAAIATGLEENASRVPLNQLAHHFLESRQYEKAADYLLRAAQENRCLGATTSAQTQLQQILSRADHLKPSRVLLAKQELGEIEYILGNYEEVERLYDSLTAQWLKQQEFEKLAEVYRLLGKISQTRGKLAEARKLFQQGLETIAFIKARIRQRFLSADFLALLAYTYVLEGNQPESERLLAEALSRLPKVVKAAENREIGTVLLIAGGIMRRAGKLQQAQDYWTEAKTYFHHRKDRQGEAMIENNLGLLHAEREEIDIAFEHYGKALDLSRQTGDLKRQGLTYMQMGNLSLLREKPKQAEIYYRDALRTIRILEDSLLEAACLTNLAFACHELGLYQKALNHQKKALEIKKNNNQPQEQAHSLYGLANTLLAIGSYKQADKLIQEGLGLIKDLPSLSVRFYLEALRGLLFIKTDESQKADQMLTFLENRTDLETRERQHLLLLRGEALLSGNKPKELQTLLEREFPSEHWSDIQKFHYPNWIVLAGEFALIEPNRPQLTLLRKHLDDLLDSNVESRELSAQLYVRLEHVRGKIAIFLGDHRKALDSFRRALLAEQNSCEGLEEGLQKYFEERSFYCDLQDEVTRLESEGITSGDEIQFLHNSIESFERLLALYPRIRQEGKSQKDLFTLLLDEFLFLTKAERGFVIFADDYNHLSVEAARKSGKETIRNPKDKISQTIIHEVLKSGLPLLTFDAVSDPHLDSAKSVMDLKLHSVLVVPLQSEDKTKGVLYFDHPGSRGVFEEKTVRLTKIFADHIALLLDQMKHINALQNRVEETSSELKTLKEILASQQSNLKHDYHAIVHRSQTMLEMLQVLDRVIPTDSTVLIHGESGTGKEMIARAIHEKGQRSDKPLISVNCGSLSPLLLESQLFGHVAGAFTGAVSEQKGYFEAADGGTLFLDEIGEMQIDLQAKMLRVLQEKEIVPVGSTQQRKVDVRIIVASNRDLLHSVQQGSFREDLYYRINVLSITVPALREREGDIDLLLEHFLRQALGKRVSLKKALTSKARRALLNYSWPGNVRELKHAVESMVILAAGRRISLSDLPESIRNLTSGKSTALAHLSIDKAKEEFLRRYLFELYLETQGNIPEMAKRAGMHRGSLYRMVRRYLPQIEEKNPIR